jgi:tetratricopeptide (TPR) repeat protein
LFKQIGNHPERKRVLTRFLSLERQRGDNAAVAETLRNLSGANRHLGLHREWVQQAKEALETFERINNTRGQETCLTRLAQLLFKDKQLDAVEDTTSRAVDLIPKKGQEYVICGLHSVLGKIYQFKGEKEKANHHFKTALEIASSFNWYNELFWNHNNLADLFRGENEFNDANTHIMQAKSFAIDNSYCQGRAMQMQARIRYLEWRFEDAKSEVLGALKIYEKLGVARDTGVCRDLLQMIEQAM